jgi:hypothetical protein
MARPPTKTTGTNMASLANFLHDFQLVRRAADLVVATRRDLHRWHERTTTAAQVNTWISADLCHAATAAKATAVELREVSARLRSEARRLRTTQTEA